MNRNIRLSTGCAARWIGIACRCEIVLRVLAVGGVLCGGAVCLAQTVCPPTPAYSVCDITFDLPAGAPSRSELTAEFRGPSHKTFLVHAFASSSNRLIVRFSPFETGAWDVRVSSNVSSFDGKAFQFSAVASQSSGWIQVANVHHFRNSGGDRSAHLWVGDTAPARLAGPAFEQWVAERARAGLTHIRVRSPSAIDENAFSELDRQLGAINAAGMIADIVLVPPTDTDRETRQAFFRYVIARCAARNATWILLDQFEKYVHAHELLREMASFLDEDPYHRLRSVGAAITSGPFADEKWMNVRSYGSSPDSTASAIEDQIFPIPAVAEVSAPTPDEFRHHLWNTSMSGAYPVAATSDPISLRYLKVWRDVFVESRFWDEEPFFDVEGSARGLSLPDTEYILYLEKPDLVTVHLENKHKWNGEWLNPLTGERTEIKNFKEDLFSGTPPDSAHDWVLHIYREGHKESLKNFRFESRIVLMQEIEVDPAKVPFEIAKPTGETVPFNKPIEFSANLKKETRASRAMRYEWTGEVTAEGESYRVLGIGASGTLTIPRNIVRQFPATLHVRLYGLNALGKLYSVDQNFGITQ